MTRADLEWLVEDCKRQLNAEAKFMEQYRASPPAFAIEEIAKESHRRLELTLELASEKLSEMDNGGWLDIESAPKDGAWIWAIEGETQFTAKWYDFDYTHLPHKVNPQRYTGWLDDYGRPVNPTHWRPLPEPPHTLVGFKATEMEAECQNKS